MKRNAISFYMRIISFIVLCTFALLQYYNFNSSSKILLMKTVTNVSINAESTQRPLRSLWSQASISVSVPAHNHDVPGPQHRQLSLANMQLIMFKYNEKQRVFNEDKFGPLTNDSVIIVVQVHNRLKYLHNLIESLSLARDISEVLLIFSHDYYNDDMINEVQDIRFCKVIQIFYPYSIQTHPNVFPGMDPKDCPKSISIEQAQIKKCNNALYPDHHGHYREANFTQIKHHWWWKANRVFNELQVTKFHTGLFLFLEEDHYVAEDFLHVLNLMQSTVNELCAHCNIFSLGNYLNTFQFSTYHKKVEAVPWNIVKHNMGFAFNRTTWTKIWQCASAFCTFDDYNWDWSMQHVSEKCLNRTLMVMGIKGPRVFHIGSCGIHNKRRDCSSIKLMTLVKDMLHMALKAQQLFPTYLTMTKSVLKIRTKSAGLGNGGWSDPRDHQLCLNMTQPEASKGLPLLYQSTKKTGILRYFKLSL